MKITDTIKYVGVNDHQVDLFEGQYKVPNGMSYNSYVILDEKIAVMDTVDANFTHEWLDNIQQVLGNRRPDYLIVQHMEPDHAANIANFMKVYPDTTVVSNQKAFAMIQNFFDLDLEGQKIVVDNGSSLSLGNHNLTFVFAPMVHWPEVMVTYDSTDKVLFSADGFGKFGALDVDEPYQIAIRTEEDMLTVKGQNISAFTPRYFRLERRTENTGRIGITGEVDYFEGQIQGTLTNQFPYPIENATLVLYGNMVQIGRMEPGETKNLADYELLRYPLGDSYLAAEHISGEDAYASADIHNKNYMLAVERSNLTISMSSRHRHLLSWAFI